MELSQNSCEPNTLYWFVHRGIGANGGDYPDIVTKMRTLSCFVKVAKEYGVDADEVYGSFRKHTLIFLPTIRKLSSLNLLTTNQPQFIAKEK